MKKFIFLFYLLFFSGYLQAQDNLKFFVKKALDNNQVSLNSASERVVEALRLLNDNKNIKLKYMKIS